jgi:hypothetical protein
MKQKTLEKDLIDDRILDIYHSLMQEIWVSLFCTNQFVPLQPDFDASFE